MVKYEDPLIDEEIHGNVNISAESGGITFLKLSSVLVIIVIALYFLLNLLVFQLIRFISFETEKSWFEPMAITTVRQFVGDDNKYPQKTAELQRIADKLRNAAIAKNPNHALSKMDIVVHYSNDEMMNAFALPAGHIVVMKGLLEKTPNENALAMVIGHEMGHIIHRDSVRKLGRDLLTKVIIAAVLGSDGVILDNSMLLISSNYSRQDESNADATGLELLYGAYGNAYGASQLFSVFAKANPSQNRWLALSASHPLPTARRKAMQRAIDKKSYHVNKDQGIALSKKLTEQK